MGGRPKKTKREMQTSKLVVYLTAEEHALVAAAAEKTSGMAVATWARMHLVMLAHSDRPRKAA